MDRAATFTLDELDLRRATRLNVFCAMRDVRTLRGVALLWGVALLPTAGHFLGATGVTAELRVGMLMFAFFVTAALFSACIGFPLLMAPLTIRRRFREEKLLRQPVSARWDVEAFEASLSGVHNRIPWADYLKWREDRHLFLFFLSSYNSQILPKRVLSEEQAEDIRRVLSACQGSGAAPTMEPCPPNPSQS
uniref:YcxB family protein n=1 Tax=Bosea sp. NBC_00436 TaxID=2969620 RepID=A0A9E7ZX43_9HYPH